ncbi:MAG: hypothetical protein H6651_15905 [Ardenticatenales bacterium]|nr:hypothetical protein [Ardenticatenales bacterium]
MKQSAFLVLSQLLAVVLLSLVGCNPAKLPPPEEGLEQPPVATEPVSTIQQAEPTPLAKTTPSAPAEPTPTNLPLPTSAAATTIITDVLTPTMSPEPNSAAAGLAIRYPDFTALDSYLRMSPVRLYLAEGTANSSAFILSGMPDSRTQIDYLDVNGDGEVDLVLLFAEPFMWGVNYIVVMLWQGTQYGAPFAIVEDTELNGGVAYEQADWTGDNVPELIWQSETVTSGSGYEESTWRQYVIRCQAECAVIWHGVRAVVWTSNSFYIGRGVQLTEIRPDPANSQVVTRSEGFSLPFISGDQSFPWRVEAAQQAIYQWDGTQFALTTTEITDAAYEIASIQELSATANNQTATVNYEFVPGNGQQFDSFLCRLWVDGAIQGESFACNPYFTQVQWLNVLGDEPAEIVVITLYETSAWLHIWQAEGGLFTRIAPLSGDLINSAWPPIQLQNLDDDPELEIVTAILTVATEQFCFAYPDPGDQEVQSCWTEFRRDYEIFDWDDATWRNRDSLLPVAVDKSCGSVLRV